MAEKYLIQQRTATGIETIAEMPVLENGKVDISWLPVVGTMGAAVIESGSNANGSYIKLADGTMICYCGPVVMRGAALNLQSETVITYPAAYISPPRIALTLLDSVDAAGTSLGGKTAVADWYKNGYWITRTNSCCAITQYGYYLDVSIRYVSLNVIAIGRWQ